MLDRGRKEIWRGGGGDDRKDGLDSRGQEGQCGLKQKCLF